MGMPARWTRGTGKDDRHHTPQSGPENSYSSDVFYVLNLLRPISSSVIAGRDEHVAQHLKLLLAEPLRVLVPRILVRALEVAKHLLHGGRDRGWI